MMDRSATTNMDIWVGSGWTINSSQSFGAVDAPPPRAFKQLSSESPESLVGLGETSQSQELEDCFELLEDLLAAEEAEREYDRHGAEGTVSYTEYRNKWLESESSV